MKPILIVGSSGFAREIYVIIKDINKKKKQWDFKGFIDSKNIGRKIIDGYKIVCDDKAAFKKYEDCSIVIAQGFPNKREKLFKLYKKSGSFKFPNIVHPSVYGNSDNIKMGEGNLVAAGSVFSIGIGIGNCNVINMSAIIAHDVKVGDYCVINPGANISGNVKVGNKCLIGSNSVVYQDVSIRDGSVLGLGCVLTRNTSINSTYFGNPAKKIL